MKRKKIYLAGPDVFREDAINHFNNLRELCDKYGFEGMAPLDNTINISDEDALTPVHSKSIFKANFQKIKECDIILANICPFRGACIDDGTAWEIGCGYTLGKKIYGYTLYADMELSEITDIMFDLTYQSIFPIVENFGHCVNLMIADSILDSGGKIFKTFEECLIDLKIKNK